MTLGSLLVIKYTNCHFCALIQSFYVVFCHRETSQLIYFIFLVKVMGLLYTKSILNWSVPQPLVELR